MISLSALELELLRCAATASKVERPARPELKVGDEVIVSGRGRSGVAVVVKKIGPQWITVVSAASRRGEIRFRRSTWRTESGSGSEDFIRTREQYEYDQRITAAMERLRGCGLAVLRSSDIGDGRLLAFAALLDLLDEADAGRAVLAETTTPESRS